MVIVVVVVLLMFHGSNPYPNLTPEPVCKCGLFKQRTYYCPNEVKSVSMADSTASTFSHVHDASGLAPHGQLEPVNDWFSLVDRSQVHWPTGRDPM